MFVIKRPDATMYLQEGLMPPRLSHFTVDVKEAQLFEIESEAEYCCKFIRAYAFNMEVMEIE